MKLWLEDKLYDLVWTSKRILRRLKPFKGLFAYEMQVGPIVCQYWHNPKGYAGKRGVGIGRLRFWHDKLWRL